MPTFRPLPTFLRDLERLTPAQRRAILVAVSKFVEDLRRGRDFRAGLRVKQVQTRVKVFEMTWAPNGRATFEYGDPVLPGHAHIIWRRIGTHDIFNEP